MRDNIQASRQRHDIFSRMATDDDYPEVEVYDSFCSWTDLLGVGEQLASAMDQPGFRVGVERVRRFHRVVRQNANCLAPAFVVADGAAQIALHAPSDQCDAKRFIKWVGAVHADVALQDAEFGGAGVRTTVCQGRALVLGEDVANSHGGMEIRNRRRAPHPDDPEWEEWQANSMKFGPAHFMAIRELQLNLAFSKAYQSNSQIRDRGGGMYVETSILATIVSSKDDFTALSSPAGLDLAESSPFEDTPALFEEWVSLRLRGDETLLQSTKVGKANMQPVQVRHLRPRTYRHREWKTLRDTGHLTDEDLKRAEVIFINPDPPWA
jgi:hypothetical protein